MAEDNNIDTRVHAWQKSRDPETGEKYVEHKVTSSGGVEHREAPSKRDEDGGGDSGGPEPVKTVTMEKPGGGTTQVPETQAADFTEKGYKPFGSEAKEAVKEGKEITRHGKTYKSAKELRKEKYDTEGGTARIKESWKRKQEKWEQEQAIKKYEKRHGEISVPSDIKTELLQEAKREKERGESYLPVYKRKLRELKTKQATRGMPGILSSEQRRGIMQNLREEEGTPTHAEYLSRIRSARAGLKPQETERMKLTELETVEQQAERTQSEAESMIQTVKGHESEQYTYRIPKEKGEGTKEVSKSKYLSYLKGIKSRAGKQARRAETKERKVRQETEKIASLKREGYEYKGMGEGGQLELGKKKPPTKTLPVSTERPETETTGITEMDVQSFFETNLGVPHQEKPSLGAELLESSIEFGAAPFSIGYTYTTEGWNPTKEEMRKLTGEMQEAKEEFKSPIVGNVTIGDITTAPPEYILKTFPPPGMSEKDIGEHIEGWKEIEEEALFSKFTDVQAIPGIAVGAGARAHHLGLKETTVELPKSMKKLGGYFEEHPKETQAEIIEEVGMSTGLGGLVIPSSALPSISSPIHSVVVETEVGTTTAWKGVSVKGNPLIGVTPEAGVTIGKPSAEQMGLTDVEFGGWKPGMAEVEAKTVGRAEVLEKAGVPEEEIQKIQTGRRIMKATEKQPSTFMSEKFIRETEGLSAGGVEVAISYTKEWGGEVEQIYGSFAARPQMKAEYVIKPPGDIDIQLDIENEQQAQKFSKNLAKRLRKEGENVRISPENKLLIEARGEGGKWHHAVDIHFKGQEQDIMGPGAPEGAWGFEFGQEPTEIEGVPSMRLSEQGLRKGGSALTLRGQEVRPKAHRMKDVPDFYWTQRTLLESKGLSPEAAKARLEPWTKAWEDIDFEQPTEIKIPLGQPSPEVSPSAFPSTSPFVSPSVSPTPSPSLGPSPSPSLAPSPRPSISPAPSPSISPAPSPVPSPSISPLPSPSPYPSVSPSISPFPSPSPSPVPFIETEPSPVPGKIPEGPKFPGTDITKDVSSAVTNIEEQFKPSLLGIAIGKEVEEKPKHVTGFGIRFPKKGEKSSLSKFGF